MHLKVILLILFFQLQVFSQSDIRVHIKDTSSKIEVTGDVLFIKGQIRTFQKVALWNGKAHRFRRNVKTQKAFIKSYKAQGNQWWSVKEKRGSEWVVKRFMGETLSVSGQNVKVNGLIVPSRIEILPKENIEQEQLSVIASVDIEKYLEVVLASEIPATWPMEALKAQAVASRSYAIQQLSRRQEQSYDVQSTIMDQVFSYSQKEKLTPELKKKIKKAVSSTRGIVLQKKSGNVLEAFYHASCGGHGEEPHNVWKNGVFFKAKKDHFCKGQPHSFWKKKIPFVVIQKKFRLPRKVIAVNVLSRNQSGRAETIQITDVKKQKVIVSGQDFRKQLGFMFLKSTRFRIKKMKDSVLLTGRGFGHGAGLCQWGAKKAAQVGLGYEKILKHYYPTARLGYHAYSRKVASL